MVDDQPAKAFRSIRTEALLSVLAVDGGAVTRTRLAGLLWPDLAEPLARHNLRQTLLQLRQSLGAATASGGAPFLLVDRRSVELNPATCDVDVTMLRAHLADAGRHRGAGDPAGAAGANERAVALYRGALLDGWTIPGSDLFDEWLGQARLRLHQEVVDAVAALTAYYDECGDIAQALVHARRWVTLDPFNENAYRHGMRLLAASGQPAAALALYEECRAALAAELGVEPDDATSALMARIRSGGERRDLRAPRGRPATGVQHIPQVGPLFGRAGALDTLRGWLLEDACRLVGVVGLGGIGKTAVAAQLVATVSDAFEGVVWWSLRNAPPPEETLAACLQALAPGAGTPPRVGRTQLDALTDVLMDVLHARRCLIVLDNAESVLEPGARAGIYRSEMEPYGRFLERVAAEPHRSAVVVTSREQPLELAPAAADQREAERPGRSVVGSDPGPVRILRLPGLSVGAGLAMLRPRGVVDERNTAHLVRRYSGNPLALEVAAATVREFFGGDVRAFLGQGAPVFDDIRAVLEQQFARLTPLERDVMMWLAVERSPVTVQHLREHLSDREPWWAVLEALRWLRRRSLLERSRDRFLLQSVVMEYATDVLVATMAREVTDGGIDRFGRHALSCTHTSEHVRQAQQRLSVAPLVRELVARLGHDGLVARLRALPDELRARPELAAGHAAGNVLTLLVALDADLTGLDLHDLAVRSVDLRGVRAAEVDLRRADLRGGLFTEDMPPITAIAFDPGGTFLAAGATDGSVRLWSAPEGRLTRLFRGHTGAVNGVAFSPDGTRVATVAMDGVLHVHQVDDRQRSVGPDVPGPPKLFEAAHRTGLVAVTWGPDGTLVSSDYDAVIRIRSADGTPLRQMHGPGGPSFALALHPDGDLLASGDQDGAVRLWDLRNGQLLTTLLQLSDRAMAVAFSPHGDLLAGAGLDGTVALWRIRPEELLTVLEGHTYAVSSLAFSPDGKLLASASWDHTVRLWDVTGQQPAGLIDGHTSHVSSARFSPDGDRLATGGYDHTLRLWDVASRRPVAVRRGHTAWVWSLVWTTDGTTLLSAHHDQTVRMWDVGRGAVRHELRGHLGEVVSVALDHHGTLIASGGNDRSVRVWSAQGQLLRTLAGSPAALYQVCLSPDGRLAAAGDVSGTATVWSVTGERLLQLRPGPDNFASPVALGRTPGRHRPVLVTPGEGFTIRLWDAMDGQLLSTLDGHDSVVTDLLLSPDATILISSGSDCTVRVWDVVTGVLRHVLRGPTTYIMSVARSLDGRWIAAGGLDGDVHVWDAATGEQRHVLAGHGGGVFAVATDPASRVLASGSADGTIRLWNLETGACTTTLRPPGPYRGMLIDGAVGVTDAQRDALRALGAVGQLR
ncbi:BTAD domain-containing putative transcriptional regulator [Cryptosporangium sp. NPDC051539]|uniref:WD40 domain-containing protein n=1 Tax=Cryptosporangium sp. NPDC051539 TaxID=3363962 RepID=UPI0037B3F2C5